MDFRTTRVAFSEIVQRSEGALRAAVTGHSFVISFAVVVEETEAMFEQRNIRFVVVAAGGFSFRAVVD